ncbi:MAG: glycoside hydrolase family 3 protein [Spirochaetales bacterium]|uniref:Glycoside hydrolase family 3 protein n=1 Tax=Candidatus Thalassospirochaeta sargassi TaxID=3119039 RepID=A0AAJ1IFZ8_9SPIO|nr:glycoside hydrolase family 3 protein [Spirochaetales bacterium]
MFRHRQLKLLTGVLVFTAFMTSVLFASPDFWSSKPDNEILNYLMSEMDDEQLLAQLMLLGYMGGSPSDEIMDWITEKEIGGVKIFGWNVGTLSSLAESVSVMQHESQKTEFKIPLFIVTDQEGGWVRHIHSGTSETSGNMSLAASRLPADSYKTGYYIGMELRALGINMNFAPTVDVYSNAEAHVIGPRAFSDDPQLTALLSTAYFKGMDNAGIICTAKHYPGHGDADKDSHGALPIIEADMETLWNRDLLPYRYLVNENIPAIMSGHLAFPGITGDETPASLSPLLLTEILRKQIGFEGLVVTDDLMMNGVQLLPMNTAEICKAAIMAGNDIILVSRTPEIHEKVWDYLSAELRLDSDFKTRVRESALRVLKTKISYLRDETSVPMYPSPEETSVLIPDEEGSAFFLDQAYRSTTVIRSSGEDGLVPEGKILLAGQLDRFFRIGKQEFPDADEFKFGYTPFYTSSKSVSRRLADRADDYDTIIYCLANPNSAEVLEALKNTRADVIVLSVLTPVYLRQMDWVENAVAVYGTSEDSFSAGFAALGGRLKPSGSLPIKF